LSFVPGQHEEEDNDKQFYSTIQSSKKKQKLTKEGRVQSIPGNIGNGDGTMKLTLESAMALEMELCALLLEILDSRVLGPPKMQEGE